MSDFFKLVSEYFWMVALAFAAFNYWKADRDVQRTIAPGKLPQAKAYLRRFSAAGSLPWLLMGAGQLSGATPTVWYYFRPQDGNPFVLGWLASILALSLLFAWWVLLHDGAKKVIEYKLMVALGQQGAKPLTERMVKFFAALGVFIFPVWVVLTMSMNTPIPR